MYPEHTHHICLSSQPNLQMAGVTIDHMAVEEQTAAKMAASLAESKLNELKLCWLTLSKCGFLLPSLSMLGAAN